MWEYIDCVSPIVLCKSCFQYGLPCLSSERAGCYPCDRGSDSYCYIQSLYWMLGGIYSVAVSAWSGSESAFQFIGI